MTSTAERKRNTQRWALWLSLAIPVAAVVIYLLIWYGPDVIARHDIGNVTGPLRVLRVQQARDAARGRLLTLGAGLFAAGALLFTGRNYRLARQTLELTEQGQVTDRYTKAIEQLGSDKLDVRIGGIYALERVARDSARDHPTVMEVLAAFIREHSREKWPVRPTGTDVPEGSMSGRMTRPDVQAAITVIGRRDGTPDLKQIDLSNADLPLAALNDLDLTGANLYGADLNGADLNEAKLKGALFGSATLTGANLDGAILTGAYLVGAKLNDAYLVGAKLNGAVLTGADLLGAKLKNADLTGADLKDAILTQADFSGADLTHARWPLDVTVPEGWVQHHDSGLLKRASGESGDAPA